MQEVEGSKPSLDKHSWSMHSGQSPLQSVVKCIRAYFYRECALKIYHYHSLLQKLPILQLLCDNQVASSDNFLHKVYGQKLKFDKCLPKIFAQNFLFHFFQCLFFFFVFCFWFCNSIFLVTML